MAKVLLVEDDNNLREIYQARLQAEGYDIATARDGEEALVVAKQEQPDLVVSDVMMPKISGFEMLDIMRNTDGLKDVKVIMLTALGQSEDQTRANSLGADRYLVKSQVTLEDIVNAAHELLGGDAAPEAVTTTEPAVPRTAEAVAAEVAVAPVASAPEPVESAPVADAASVESAEPLATPPVIPLAAAPDPTDDTQADAALSMPPTPVSTLPDVPTTDQPVNVTEPATTQAPAEPTLTVTPAPATDDVQNPGGLPTSAEEAAVAEQQIKDFVANQTQPAAPVEPVAAPAPEAPVQPATPAESAPTTTEQEQALNEAVTSLSGGTTAPEAPEVPAAADTTPEAAGHSKVIMPLGDDSEAAPKKSLDELLAAEDAKDAAPAESTAPAAPAQSAAEPAQTPPKPANSDFDPNSIAL